MLRISFGRKNRVMSAEFKNKKILETLESNYSKHCSINNKPVPMDFDFKSLIDEALEESEQADKRARQMDMGKDLNTLNSLSPLVIPKYFKLIS